MSTSILETHHREEQCSSPTKSEEMVYVEIDNTLVATDTFLEALILLLRKNLLYMFLVPIWALQGTGHVRENVAARISFDVTHLPYRQEVLHYLNNEASLGKKLFLLSGWNRQIAQDIANHLGIFTAIEEQTNLSDVTYLSSQKYLQDNIAPSSYSYVCHRLPVNHDWAVIPNVIVVQPRRQHSLVVPPNHTIQYLDTDTPHPFSVILKAFRVHQWSKNILLFFPLVTAHQLFHVHQLVSSLGGFLAFSLCASSLYLLNDLLDLAADRRHPKKRTRPLASGALSIKTVLWLQPALFFGAFLISATFLPPMFSILLIGYALTTMIYSIYLKKVAIVDVLTLAGFYTLRLFAGGIAVGLTISAWLLAFSGFFFLSLAFGKRYAELQFRKVEKFQGIERRAYVGADKEIVGTMGTISGYLSVLVFALYINSPEVSSLYRNPQILWFLCPLLLYWISRTWLMAHRGCMDDDPLITALQDPRSYVIGILALGLTVLAI